MLIGDRIRYELPGHAAYLLDILRQHRAEVLRGLRGRQDESKRQLSCWIAVRCSFSERVWGSEKSLYRDYIEWCQKYNRPQCPRELFGAILDNSFQRDAEGWQGLCLALDFMASIGSHNKSLNPLPLSTTRVQ